MMIAFPKLAILSLLVSFALIVSLHDMAAAARVTLTPVQDTVIHGPGSVPHIGQRTVNYNGQGLHVDAHTTVRSIAVLGYDLSGVQGEIIEAYLQFYQINRSASTSTYSHTTNLLSLPPGTPMFDETRLSFTTFETDYGFSSNHRAQFGRINGLPSDSPNGKYIDSVIATAAELAALNAMLTAPTPDDRFAMMTVRGASGWREWGDREGTALGTGEANPVKLVLITLVPEPATALLLALASICAPVISRHRLTALAVAAALGTAAIGSPASARTGLDSFSSGVTVGEHTMPFRLFLPKDYSHDQEYPLVVYMHGSGSRGTDNQSHVQSNSQAGLYDRTYEEYPSILVAPQVMPNSSWHPLLEEDLTLEIIDWVEANYSVDQDRRYLTGLSMGGFGTTSYALYHPEMWAAIAPIAGATTIPLSVGDPIADIPTWLFHGNSDGIVDVSFSRDYYLNATGEPSINFTSTELGFPTARSGNIIYTELPGHGHNVWDTVYTDGGPGMYDWMFAQRRSSLTIIPQIPEPHAALLLLCVMLCGVAWLR